MTRQGDILGCARVSAADQGHCRPTQDRLTEAGAVRVLADVISGERAKCPALIELIDCAWPGDRLCVARLDRHGRSLKELL